MDNGCLCAGWPSPSSLSRRDRGGTGIGPQDLARLARIREEFGPFFSRATENRMTVRTTLAP